MDFVFGVVIYLTVALVSGRALSLIDLVIVLFFAFAPDLDSIPFALLRKRLKLVSHWIIHFPIYYIPIGTGLVWVASHDWFYVATFILASLAHFLHDSRSVHGLRWFGRPWPAYQLKGFKLVRVNELERRLFYGRLRQGAAKRSILDEVRMRIGKGRPE